MSRRTIGIGLLLVAAVVAALVVPRLFAGRGIAEPAPGTVVLTVGGRYKTTMTFAAAANWCPVSRVANIEGISVDSGFAIALRETNEVSKGVHPVLTAEMASQASRPNATAALRWLRMRDTVVVAYRSYSGRVEINEIGATISGTLLLNLVNSVGKDSILVQGRFAGLKVVAMAAGCT